MTDVYRNDCKNITEVDFIPPPVIRCVPNAVWFWSLTVSMKLVNGGLLQMSLEIMIMILSELVNPVIHYSPFTNDGLSTLISKSNGSTSSDFLTSSFGRWQNRGPSPDRSLILAFKTIAAISDRLGLVATIKNRANEIYKNLVEDHQKSFKRRNHDAILAACLYIACRQEHNPRTMKEICSVVKGASKKEIGRAKKHIELEMGQTVEMGTIHAGHFMRRFCSNLGMTNQLAVKAEQEAVQKLEELLDIRSTPITIAAVVIYIVHQLSDDKKKLKDVSVATGVAERTIRKSCIDIHPYLSKIIPSWYQAQVGVLGHSFL